MSHIEVHIDTDNAAFRLEDGELDSGEVNRLLEHVAGMVAAGFHDGALRDVNGARCGRFTVVEDGP